MGLLVVFLIGFCGGVAAHDVIMQLVAKVKSKVSGSSDPTDSSNDTSN